MERFVRLRCFPASAPGNSFPVIEKARKKQAQQDGTDQTACGRGRLFSLKLPAGLQENAFPDPDPGNNLPPDHLVNDLTLTILAAQGRCTIKTLSPEKRHRFYPALVSVWALHHGKHAAASRCRTTKRREKLFAADSDGDAKRMAGDRASPAGRRV